MATVPRQANGADRAEALAALAEQLRCAIQDEQDHCYTLHLDFAADDATQARTLALVLVAGLSILRAEVHTYSAAVSPGGRWAGAEAVFCMAGGPEGAFCAYAAGHAGWHAEAGVDGLRWGEGDGDGTRG